MRRGWAIGLGVLVVLAGVCVVIAQFPESDRDGLVGRWRLYTDQPLHWHIVLREDGTGTMSSWDYTGNREKEPREIVWSADAERRHLSIRAVEATRYWRGELGGPYELHGRDEYLELDHAGGENPGRLMYSRVE